MKRTSPLRWLSVVVALFLFSSCSSSGGIDNYFTFNVQKSFTFLSLYDSTHGLGTIPMPDSSDYTANGTSLSLIKSVKMTRFSIVPKDPAFPLVNEFDSLHFSDVSDDPAGHEVPFAFYYSSSDSVFLSDIDFVSNLKLSYYHFTFAEFPQKTIKIAHSYTAYYTLVFTAQPLP